MSTCCERAEVDALARVEVHADEQVGPLVVARARSCVDDLLLGDAGRQRLRDDSLEDEVRASPSSFGPSTANTTLTTPSSTTNRTRDAVRAAAGASRRLADGPKFIDFSTGMPMPPNGPPPLPGPRADRAGPTCRALRRRARRLAVSCSLMLPPPRSAGTRRSRRRSARSRAARRACRRPTISPSSSTRIWSASTMVDTRCATMIIVASVDLAVAALARSRASVASVERRERVVEDVDLRALHERTRDREPLALAARDVGAALGDRRLEPLGHLGDEVLGLRDLERMPELLVGRVGLAVAQVGCDGARRTGTRFCGTRPIRDHSRSGSSSRTSTPSTSTAPAGRVEQARQQVRRAWSCRRPCCR